jgi:hypothetical protein
MTTIVYTNGFLAADTRMTFTKPQYMNDTVCLGCGEKHNAVNENTIKIHAPDKGKWHGESIVALGASGNKAMIDKAMETLLVGGDLLQKVAVLREFGEVSDHCNYRMLIVTPTKVIVFDPRHYRKEYEKEYPLTADIAVGSGEDVARFALNAFGVSASDAVQAAAFEDDGTGGEVHWIDCQEGADRTRGSEPIMPPDQFKAYLASWKPFQ